MIWLLLLVLIGYLWWINSLPASPKESMTNSSGPLEVDVHTFDRFYSGRRNQINQARLDRVKDNEFVVIFNVFMDASKKGKRVIVYRDLPSSPKMYSAFEALRSNPDEFFNVLSELSSPPVRDTKVADQSNSSNIGLQIENVPVKTNQYVPRNPTAMWKHIERSRGPH